VNSSQSIQDRVTRLRRVSTIGKRIEVCAAVLLLQINLALAVEPTSTASAAPAQQSPPAAVPQQAVGQQVPFDEVMRHSYNPIDPYRGQTVAPPSLANSPRLSSLVRDGKLYISLRDAIELALENNLDLVIARYNLPIAQTDVLRTASGGILRGVNTGVVSGTPGGNAGGGATGTGAGGTSTGAGGAGAGAAGIVSSTLGTGTAVSSYDPLIAAQLFDDYTAQPVANLQQVGVPIYKTHQFQATVSYAQAFPTGTNLSVDWGNFRQTSNAIYDYFSPQYYAKLRVIASQQLLAGFGLGTNLRYLRIARTNQQISDIAFKAQVIATVTQVCDIYWDLVSAYDTEQVNERSVAFATDTLDKSRKQFELQAIPEMDVLKAEGDLATRQQDLTVARTTLQLQELYMKNAVTRNLDDPSLEEMPVVPTDRIGTQVQPVAESVQDMISDALKNRTDLQEQNLVLQTSELSRKTARNALLPSLGVYALYGGQGLGGALNPVYYDPSIPTTHPPDYPGALKEAFDNTQPEYQVGFQLSVPLRNRAAKADQYRAELEYRQSQVGLEEARKRILIEVRNARYALEQGASRIDAARKARDLSQRTLDIMQKEQQLGAGSNQQTLSAEHDLAVAESALVTAETAYEKSRIEMRRATGSILEEYGISIADAKTGVVEASHP
jgi:outer membrane protein TolC